jgi:hypothetical protein
MVTRARFERATPSFGDLRAKAKDQQLTQVVTRLFKSVWCRLETA